MDELETLADSVPSGMSDKPFLALTVFGLCFFLALVVWFAPLRES